MKFLICLVVLFSVCNSENDGDGKDDVTPYLFDKSLQVFGRNSSLDEINIAEEEKRQAALGEKRVSIDGIGNKHEEIYHPCALHDLDCIRRVFAHNSHCKPVKGHVDDPYTLHWLPLHLANANMTFILHNAQIRGLNDWKINEFYINKVTDKLVLEVVFKTLTIFSPAAIARYHRKGKESVDLSGFSTIVYKDISLTLTVPHVKHLQLDKASVFAYIPDANPTYCVGPAISDSSDPHIAAAFLELTSNIAVTLKETFIAKGPIIMKAFLEGTICDFYTAHYSKSY